jgi:hypothetical protein
MIVVAMRRACAVGANVQIGHEANVIALRRGVDRHATDCDERLEIARFDVGFAFFSHCSVHQVGLRIFNPMMMNSTRMTSEFIVGYHCQE